MPRHLSSARSSRKARLFDQLRGGDLRSTGNADHVAGDAERDPALVRALVAGLESDEPVVRMRCADALEKVTRNRPERLAPYRARLFALLHPGQPKELLWHLLQMCPRVRWEASALPDMFSAVEACLRSASSIVKTSAMQALFELTAQAPERTGEVHAILGKLSRTGTPAMKARGAKLLRKRRAAGHGHDHERREIGRSKG